MRAALTERISLDDFVFEMMRVPTKELRLPQLQDLMVRLDLRDDLIEEHIHFSKECYARNLLCRTPRFDMLVLCWKPDQVTTIHDHAGSLNVTRVYRGTLTSRTFDKHDRPSPGRIIVRMSDEELLEAGALSTVDFGGIHQLANTSRGDLITVHVYARPLKDITVYDPATGEVQKVALRYTLEDEFA
jgi:predicted metal-dependent enzyme (double-stranded beta helix superfamily)